MKAKLSFVCSECGYDSPAFMGKCPECGTWNSLREIKIPTFAKASAGKPTSSGLQPKRLSEIKFEEKDRIATGFSEFDNVLGGGLVPGSVILLAGDPGIGKSTLLLQLALNVASIRGIKSTKGIKGRSTSDTSPTLYISGEESEQQIKLRTNRLVGHSSSVAVTQPVSKDVKRQTIRASKTRDQDNLLLLSLTNTDAAVEVIAKVNPRLVIIDSIQTMESENLAGLSGSVGQVRYAALEFIKTAKELNITFILVGHVTKEGMVAGPMVLSHMVDTLLFLEGEKFTRFRILRGLKNRFGPIDEVGVFEMRSDGMNEVKNPQQIFLSSEKEKTPGSVLTATLEGTRAFLVEIQALAVFSKLPMPRRVAAGIDYRRLELLLAVLQKHARLPVDTMDIYVNVAGGLRLSDPAADLAICLSVFSSLKNIPVNKVVGIAEVGLLGELREASEFSKRVKEARKLGFSNIIGTDKYKTLNQVISEFAG